MFQLRATLRIPRNYGAMKNALNAVGSLIVAIGILSIIAIWESLSRN
jgi:hypothetical protein